MKTLIPMIVEELSAGRAIGLATVLQAKGSAPRGAGACQLLCRNGRALGTVGGGVLERRALNELQALLSQINDVPTILAARSEPDSPDASSYWTMPSDSASFSAEYALTQNEVQSLGMVCGGNVSMLYQVFTPEVLPFFQRAQRLLSAGGNLWLLLQLAGGRVQAMALADGSLNPTSLSQQTYASLCARKPVFETFSDSSATDVATTAWFSQPVMLASHTYVFGGGHVAQCVAPLLAKLDFSPVVYDDRVEFTLPELFPGTADVVCAPFTQAGDLLTVSRNDEIVIMTRGHVNDLIILTFALRTPAYYIGLIGSHSKIEHTRKMLLEQGFTDADFARVHTPIGVPILAETPMEIAVSVAAEMIQCRAEHADERGDR